MKLLSLELVNFMSYKKTQIQFPDGITGILGKYSGMDGASNGAGKSAIPEAVLYALYGYDRAGGEKDLIRLNQTIMKVVLEFVIDSDVYKIKRGRSKDDYVLKLWINGEDKSSDKKAETQREIFKRLGFRKEAFEQTVAILQNDSDAFLQSTTAGATKVISQLYGYDFLDLLIKEVRDRVRDSKTQMNSMLSILDEYKDFSDDKKLDELETSLQEIRDWITTKEGQIKLVSRQSTEVEKKIVVIEKAAELINEIKTSISKADKRIPLLQASINDCKMYMETVEKKTMIIDTKLEKIKAEIDFDRDFDKEIEVIMEQRAQVADEVTVINKDIAKLESRKDVLENDYEQFFKIGAECDKCGQKVDEAYTERRLQEMKKEISNFGKKIDKYTLEYAGKVKENNGLVNQSESLHNEQRRQNSLRADVKNLETKLEGLDEAIKMKTEKLLTDSDSLKEAEKEKKDLETKLKQTKTDSDTSELESQKTELDLKIISLEKDFVKMTNKERELADKLVEFTTGKGKFEQYSESIDELKRFQNRFTTLEKVFVTVRSQVTKQTVRQISRQANLILSKISGFNYNIDVELIQKAKKQELEIKIGTGEQKRGYKTFSGGERVPINLAIHLAKARLLTSITGVKPSFLFLDELIAPVDQIGREGFVNVLSYLKSQYAQILCITHSSEVNEIFEKMIVVEKSETGDQGISTAKVI